MAKKIKELDRNSFNVIKSDAEVNSNCYVR